MFANVALTGIFLVCVAPSTNGADIGVYRAGHLGVRADAPGFALHNGDRVAFYGDSITDNAPYTKYVEAYIRLHYPKLRVSFVNAGVGGDRVSGGWMGPIDQRLTRDLMSRHPTVVTVMLGMNDGSYRPFDDGLFSAYQSGFQHIADRFGAEIPKARVWLIQPSPYDDITRAPNFPGGYNGVLQKYAEFVKDLAAKRSYGLIDFNAPIDDMLTRANASNPASSQKILPDRVHPSAAGHLVMAASLLKAWGATGEVSRVDVDAKGGVTAEDASISGFKGGDQASWDELDARLPFPFNHKDPLVNLVLASWPLEETLGTEMLTVKNLSPGTYALRIDSKPFGTYSDTQLAAGIDLAQLDTPMSEQAAKVEAMVWKRADFRYNAWRNDEYALQGDSSPELRSLVRAVDKESDRLDEDDYRAAQPVTHHFQISKQ